MDFYYGYDLRNMSQRMPVNNIEIIGPYNKIVDREPILGDYIITRVYVGYWMWNSYGKVIGFNKDEKNEIIDMLDGGTKSVHKLSYEKGDYVIIEQDKNLTKSDSNHEIIEKFNDMNIKDYPPIVGIKVITKVGTGWCKRKHMIGNVTSLDESNKKAIVSFGNIDYAIFYDDLLVILDDDCYRLSNGLILPKLLELGINKSRLEDCEISNVEFFDKIITVQNRDPKEHDLVITRERFENIEQASIGRIISLDEEKKIAEVNFGEVINLKYDNFAVIEEKKVKKMQLPPLENHQIIIPKEVGNKKIVNNKPSLFDDVVTRVHCGEYRSNTLGKITDIRKDEIVVEIKETQFILKLSEVAIFSH